MQIKTLNWLIVLGLLISFVACQDNQVTPEPRFRIKKVTPVYANSTDSSFATYEYDANNQLRYVLNYSVRPNSVSLYVFSRRTLCYDEQGRLTKFEDKLEDNGINRIPSSYQRTTYAYDTNGRATTVNKYQVFLDDPSHPLLTENRQLQYGSNQFPDVIKVKVNADSQFDPVIDLAETYTYSGGNVRTMKRTYYPTHANNTLFVVTDTFQYDDKPNPFYGFLSAGYDGFSKNNVMESGTVSSYNTGGLLIRKARADNSLVTAYDYEAY